MRTPRPHGAFTPSRHTPSTLVTKGRVHHEYTSEEGGCRRGDRQLAGSGRCSPDHGAGRVSARRLGARRLRHDEDVSRIELSGDRGSAVLDERVAVRGRDGERRSRERRGRVCEDNGDVSGCRSARHGLARRLPDEIGNSRSSLPRSATRQRRLDAPTQLSGAVTQTPVLCRTGSAPGETKQERVGRAAHRLAPFSSGGWNPRLGLH